MKIYQTKARQWLGMLSELLRSQKEVLLASMKPLQWLV